MKGEGRYLNNLGQDTGRREAANARCLGKVTTALPSLLEVGSLDPGSWEKETAFQREWGGLMGYGGREMA